MKLKFIAIFSILIFFSCKINRIKNNERHGKWIHLDTIDNIIYKSVGRYKLGIEQKTWKQFCGKKLVRLEKYKNGICFTKNFHKNGAVSSQGSSKMIVSAKELHWFYIDEWQFFDESGKRIRTKVYNNDNLNQIIVK